MINYKEEFNYSSSMNLFFEFAVGAAKADSAGKINSRDIIQGKGFNSLKNQVFHWPMRSRDVSG